MIYNSPNKVQNPYNAVDMYQEYVDWLSEKELYLPSRKDFIVILNDFNTEVKKKLLEGETFFLPAGMGEMRIVKSKNNMPISKKAALIDWEKSKQYGKHIYYTNDHSNGYRYKIRWDVSKSCKHGHKYYFIPSRIFKRALAKIIKSRSNDYFQKV